MQSRRASFKQSDATRALRAAQKAGLKPTGYRVEANGAIVVQFGNDQPSSEPNPWDEVLQ